MEKPTVEQVAWVFEHIAKHIQEGGTFRYLIYDRMKFDLDAYGELYEAGGMFISNAICDYNEMLQQRLRAKKKEREEELVNTPGFINWARKLLSHE